MLIIDQIKTTDYYEFSIWKNAFVSAYDVCV